jgi:hypothetical protein
VPLDVARESVAEAVCERQVHETSDRRIREYKWRGGVGSKGDGSEVGEQGTPTPTPLHARKSAEEYETRGVKYDSCVHARL